MPLNIPQGSQTCELSILNAECYFTLPPEYLVEPAIPGYKWMNLPTFSFYIKHNGNGKELLFDMGCRSDWDKSAPHVANLLPAALPGLDVRADVMDILTKGGVDLNKIEAFIISHYHFDHIGNLEALPKSIKAITGPGFEKHFLPGYPKGENSPFNEADFEGRELVEIPFNDGFKIGDLNAHDYFGDGSLYILDTPGHTPAHISALVRTTPDTFVFLGGDICHHSGDFRPSSQTPIPDTIPASTPLDKAISKPCPCSAFLSSHPDGEAGKDKPFLKISAGKTSFYEDPPLARKTARNLEDFDADPNVLICIAHDPTYSEVFDFFPNGTLNDWKAKGWKDQSTWGFLNELPYNGAQVRGPLLDGMYLKGKKLRGLDLPKPLGS